MKKLFSALIALSIITTFINPHASAGQRHTRMLAPGSPFSCGFPTIPDEAIEAIQNDAVKKLYTHDATVVDSSKSEYIDSSFRGTAFAFNNVSLPHAHYLYFPNLAGTPKNVITALIPVSSVQRSMRYLGEFINLTISRAAQIGLYTYKDKLEEKIDDIYGQILEKINSNDYDPNNTANSPVFMQMCESMNILHLFDLINEEFEKLQSEGKDIDSLGFLVTEVANRTDAAHTLSTCKTGGPSTFYIKTIPITESSDK